MQPLETTIHTIFETHMRATKPGCECYFVLVKAVPAAAWSESCDGMWKLQLCKWFCVDF